jgi:opacity protein-like surface antigen
MRNCGRAALVSALLIVAFASQAQAAETVGENFTPSNSDLANPCYQGNTLLQTSWPGDRYAVRSKGIITAWSFQADGFPPALRFKVARPAGGDNFTVVGQSDLKFPTANSLNTYTDVSISVQPGDVIGYYVAAAGDCARIAPDYSYEYVGTDVTTGITQPFAAGGQAQLDLSARVEADASPPEPPDTSPPETTITKAPKKKSETAKVRFEFRSSEPDSAFECELDEKPFRPCSSPEKFKAKVGKHKFLVRAIDPSQNVDPSPDRAKFEVVG